jgi:holdfast attachment protein HfaA
MTHTKKLIALTILALSATTAAQAGDWTNSGMYNGYGAASQNTASGYSMRVNGQVTSSQYASNSGGQSAYAGGVGTSGANAYGQATAIGNSLNVTVIGSHNTTIIDSNQVNTGNQTATAELNSH